MIPAFSPNADFPRRGMDSPGWKGGKIILICDFCKRAFYVFPSTKRNQKKRFCKLRCYHGWQQARKAMIKRERKKEYQEIIQKNSHRCNVLFEKMIKCVGTPEHRKFLAEYNQKRKQIIKLRYKIGVL